MYDLTLLPNRSRSLPRESDRDALMKAHDVAADFHNAMSAAINAEQELADESLDELARTYFQRRYKESLGEAAVAMQKMPVKWLAILECELPKAEP